jgi:tellurite resistance-related uncharacterized protein
MPSTLVPYNQTDVFTEETVPEGLTDSHATRAGVWAMIRVLEGELRLRILDEGDEDDQILDARTPGLVEPEQLHEVEPVGAVRFYVQFFREPGG